jgi:formylglycine-generating enzyme required for sulfatase activity
LAQADELLARRGDIARTVNELRKQALPPTAAEIETDRRKHPEFARWQRQAQKLAAFERAQAIRDGAQDLALPAPTAAELALSPAQLNELAWQWVDSDDSKRTFGEEARALMLAQLACARAQDAPPAQRAWFGDTLAWAWFANGKDEEALAQSTAVVALSPPEGRAGYEGYLADMRARVAAARGGGWSEKLQTLRAEVAALDGAVATRLTYNFAPTDEAQRFLHETLVELQRGMDALAANQRQAMAARLRWARGVEGWTRAHPKARTTWQEARQSIAAADGVVASELYRGQAITLPEPDVIGLVPIGMNPVTKLWEFYDLRSAWDGKRDPATIEIPRYVSAGEHHGHIEVRDDTGIVFVLLPGGTFTMGAQAADSNGANYDRDASSHETPHKITLHAFFLARHEMTQGQWQRLSDGEVPSLYHPEYVWGGQPGNPSQRFGWMSPVENVDWLQCERCLSQHGMVLPTEAQWEYGCRAGTSTVWWTGSERESLRGAVNIADGTWKKGGSAGPSIDDWPGFEDGFIVHAPVDSLLPNAFGLHHTHGNVWEWCADWWGYYSQPARAGDGLRLVPLGSLQARIFRGGGFSSVARNVRSALRSRQVPSQRSDALGVRPARGLPRDNP